MICLINLNTIQAPYLVLFVNVKTFRLYSQKEFHKQLVCLHRRILQRKFQPYHVPLTTPLDSPLLHPVLLRGVIRKIVLPKDDIRNRQLLISILPDCLRESSSLFSPTAQTDDNDINSVIPDNRSTNDIHPSVYSENSPLVNQDDSCTQSQHMDEYVSSDLSVKKDAFKNKWTNIFSRDISWSEFCSSCDQFAVETCSLALEIAANSSPTSQRRKPLPRCNRPSGRRPAFRHRPLLLNSVEAQRIQTLYQHSKKKGARKYFHQTVPHTLDQLEVLNPFSRTLFPIAIVILRPSKTN